MKLHRVDWYDGEIDLGEETIFWFTRHSRWGPKDAIQSEVYGRLSSHARSPANSDSVYTVSIHPFYRVLGDGNV